MTLLTRRFLSRLSDAVRIRARGGRELRFSWATYDDISEELRWIGVDVKRFSIDVPRFWSYVEGSGYRQMDYFEGGDRPSAEEKWLEHFVSIELLEPRPGEVVVDVASAVSPFPDIVRARYGSRVYRQDLSYPIGLDGDRVGGDASELPFPDGSIDKMSLHCSFEHFEGDSDMRFLREAARALKPGGRLCILPLYTSEVYSIQTDLASWKTRAPVLDPKAVVCVAENWGESHGRFYDADGFVARIAAASRDLALELYRVENFREVANSCYLKLAALFTRR